MIKNLLVWEHIPFWCLVVILIESAVMRTDIVLMLASNNKSVGAKVGFIFPRFRGAYKRSVRNLGVDFAAGNRISRMVQNARLKVVRQKCRA